jgi:hypothetical protein
LEAEQPEKARLEAEQRGGERIETKERERQRLVADRKERESLETERQIEERQEAEARQVAQAERQELERCHHEEERLEVSPRQNEKTQSPGTEEREREERGQATTEKLGPSHFRRLFPFITKFSFLPFTLSLFSFILPFQAYLPFATSMAVIGHNVVRPNLVIGFFLAWGFQTAGAVIKSFLLIRGRLVKSQ